MRPWIVAVTLLSWSPLQLHAATTCPESGIAPPSEITLAAAASGADDVAVLVKDSDCDEVSIDATASENPGEYRINASYVDIAVVESYPAVASLWLWNNKIKTFKAVGTSVTEVDITSNQLTSLDGLEFPSSVQMLTLDLNAITSTSASDFPEKLQKLYLRKNSIDSLAKFRFSASLQNLYLNGNQQLTTLEGAVFPDSLQYIECSDCRITEIVGVTFPSSLKTMTLGGTSVTNFVVRESDVEVLQSAQLSLTVSLDSDCSGTVTVISDDISACVLDDVSFSSLYPTNSSDDSATGSSSSESSTTSTAGSDTGSSTTNTGSTDQATGSGGTNTTVIVNKEGSSSNAGLYGGIAAAVVVVLAVVGFVIYRRRKNRQHEQSRADGFMALPADKDQYNGVTGATTSQTLSLPPSSTDSGYMSNDVRNDEDLIPFRLPVNDVVIERELASGGFGIVYLARLYSNHVVVKQILPKAMSKDLLRRFMDEIRLFARMDHPKIVRFIGLSWTNLMDLSLIVEFMPRGDLTTLIRQKHSEHDSRRSFSWLDDDSQPRNKIGIALDMAEALVYMHSFDPTIIHRDIKSRNVLLNHEWEAKLSDFGISRESSNEETMTGGMGTTAWIAPEVLQGERYSESADIFSFGIVLSEMDTCGHPYNSNRSEADALTDAKIALLVSSDAIKPTIEQDCPMEIRELILQCVAFDPASRPSAVMLHYQLRTIASAYREIPMI